MGMYRYPRGVLAVAAFIVVSTACGAPPQPANGPSDTAADEAAIRAHAQGFEAALNSRDFGAFAEQFTSDGDLAVGDVPLASGHEAIQRTIATAWTDAPATRRATISVDRIRFVGPDAAVVDATARFSEGEPAQDRGTSVVVRGDSGWRTLVLRILPAPRR
jgi:uncharacterized protein (TIGR02246 family)